MNAKNMTWMMRGAVAACFAVGAGSMAQAQTADLSAKTLKRLDAAWAKSVEDFEVPSMAVAVVKDGEVVWAKAYGAANAETGTPADEHSLYAVASNTKAFTAALLAQLVDEGLIAWDDRVRDHWPEFTMYDAWVTDHMTIRDLLCHRSGLKTFSGDLLWYGTSHSAEDVLGAMRHLEPTFGFRAGYGYSNLMFMVAGEVAEAVTGQSWAELVRQRLLMPAGMGETLVSTSELARAGNIAAPHNFVNGANEVIDWVNWDNMAPAGALISSAADMAKWMIVQLDSGRVGDLQLWEPKRTHDMWTMQTPIPVSSFYAENLPTMHFRGYGLGWELYDLHGRKVVAHSGGYDGMISRQVLVPEEKLGFIFLTNNITSLSWAWGHDALNAVLGGGFDFALVETILGFQQEERAAAADEEKALEAARVPNTSPSVPLADLAGTYRDKMYGDIVISVDGDNLHFDFLPTDLFEGTLTHWHHDTFRLSWDTKMMLPKGFAQFEFHADGTCKHLLVDVPNPDFHFTEHIFEKVNEGQTK
jgi:CubicO group peptidase (beta-lactamase class C family)